MPKKNQRPKKPSKPLLLHCKDLNQTKPKKQNNHQDQQNQTLRTVHSNED